LNASSASADDATLLEEDLMELVVHPSILERAWRKVKRNRGAPGPDGMTIKEFEPWAQANWPAVKQQLLDGTYRPGPVRRKTIEKESRRLDPSSVADVLLETVALRADEGGQAPGAGRQFRLGDQARDQSQVVLADVSDTGDAVRDAKPLAGRTGITFISSTLVRASSTSKNRLVRTRLLGGVGAAVRNGRGYPIYSAV
jgi:hypothetical protein